MVYNYMGSLVILPTIRTNIVIAWALNVSNKLNLLAQALRAVDKQIYSITDFIISNSVVT